MENGAESVNYISLGQKVPSREKVFWGFGVLADTLLAGIFGLYMTDYYINEVMISYGLFIIAQAIYLVVNSLNDLLFGFYADRTRTKLGRRIPYIRYGAPIYVLTFIFLWFPLPGTYPGNPTEGQAMKFLQLMMGYVLFDTMLTIVILSLVALPPEMTESTSERAKFSIYQTIFGGVGGVLIFIVPSIVFLGWDVFRVFIIIVAIIAMFSFIILSFGVKERKKLYEQEKYDQNLLKEVIQTFKNRSFISFIIFYFSVSFLQALAITFTPFYSAIVGIDNDTLVLLSFYIGNGIAIPTCFYLLNKIEISKIIVISATTCLIVILSLYIIDLIFSVTFVYFIIFTFVGLLFGTSIVYYPYIGNCIDQDELNTNRRREGMHFGVNALFSKTGESGPAILGATVLSVTGYIQGGLAAEQPISAINGLKFLITIVPIIFAIICILSQLINPLKGENLKRMKENVMKLHELKETGKET